MTVNRHGQNIERKRSRERIYSKNRYAEAKKLGLCIVCRSKPPGDGRRTCAPCRERCRIWKKAMRRKMSEALHEQSCSACGDAGHNILTCNKSEARRLEYQSKAVLDRVEPGDKICGRCYRRPCNPGLSTCSRCRILRRRWVRKTYLNRKPTAGRQSCTLCGLPAHNSRTCPIGNRPREVADIREIALSRKET